MGKHGLFLHEKFTYLHPENTQSFSLSLNIFILQRLRNKFLQLILISLDSASWELHQYSHRMCGPMKNPKVETRSWDSNLGPHDCKADALPHDHGQHKASNIVFDEDIMDNNYMSVMFWNLSVISHWIFPQYFFLYFWSQI